MSDFSNRELEMMFENISEKLDTHQTENVAVHKTILEQVISTNGRVRILEQWRWALAGGLAVLTVLVIPITIKLIEIWVK